jgi:2-haloacid dehalogenase
MPEARAVVFDIGRVLYHWEIRALMRKLVSDEEELEHVLTHVVSEEWHFQHDRGRPLSEMLPERKAEFPHYAGLIDAYATRFLETIPGPVEGTHELVERLAGRDVPVFGLTNFGVAFWEMFRPTAPVFDHFQDIVVSGIEKCAKPDPRIYEISEKRFGHDGPALFFTDDNPANIAAARARGWQAHLFEGAELLERQLVAAGLLA